MQPGIVLKAIQKNVPEVTGTEGMLMLFQPVTTAVPVWLTLSNAPGLPELSAYNPTLTLPGFVHLTLIWLILPEACRYKPVQVYITGTTSISRNIIICTLAQLIYFLDLGLNIAGEFREKLDHPTRITNQHER